MVTGLAVASYTPLRLGNSAPERDRAFATYWLTAPPTLCNVKPKTRNSFIAFKNMYGMISLFFLFVNSYLFIFYNSMQIFLCNLLTLNLNCAIISKIENITNKSYDEDG